MPSCSGGGICRRSETSEDLFPFVFWPACIFSVFFFLWVDFFFVCVCAKTHELWFVTKGHVFVVGNTLWREAQTHGRCVRNTGLPLQSQRTGGVGGLTLSFQGTPAPPLRGVFLRPCVLFFPTSCPGGNGPGAVESSARTGSAAVVLRRTRR